MCGIAAIFSKSNIEDVYIKKMINIIKHRGPDNEGIMSLFHGKAYLAHRRLAIVDISKLGEQPMCYKNRYWITYNGEIYNYLELRKELEQLGHIFVSNADTEIVLAAYAEWGKECLHKFNGMWAFVIVDIFTENVFISRDRFGVKPLYYWKASNGQIMFASEIKQFTVLPGWRAKMNTQRVFDFMHWGVNDHCEETMFENVFQIRGGMAWEGNCQKMIVSFIPYKWYELKKIDVSNFYEEAVKQFRNILIDAIRIRLRADVSIGTGLSGGLDSSSITCIINELLGKDSNKNRQNTFSVYSDVEKYDEREYINEVLKYNKVNHYYTIPSYENLFKEMETIIWHHDEPFNGTSIYAEWEVFKMVNKKDVRVTIDGHGADELLIGYHSFFGAFLLDLIKKSRLLQFCKEGICIHEIHKYTYENLIKKILWNILPHDVLSYKKGNLFSVPDWININKLENIEVDLYKTIGNRANSVSALSREQLLFTSLPKQLHWYDRDSMAHSVEGRAPFLDYRVVEFLYSCPNQFKMSQGITKRILRDAMVDTLPEKIKNRINKIGFATPEEEWIKTYPREFILKIKEAIEQSEGFLDENILIKAKRIIEGKEIYDNIVWKSICLGKWMRIFNVKY